MKYFNFAILASFFCLWLDSLLSNNAQIIVGFILILTFGILHGANDLLLIRKIDYNKEQISFQKTLIYYIIVVGLGSLMFWIIPWFALLLFIIVSGYHFGEQQWENLEKSTPFKLFEFIYGLFILMLLFNFNIKEVQEVIQNITSIVVPKIYFTNGLIFNGVALVASGVYFSNKLIEFKNRWMLETFYLLVFTVIFRVSSLIWGFAIYFIIWHSIPSIINQIIYLNGEVNCNNFIKYIRTAFLYWVISLIGIATLYLLFKEVEIFNALFFSFLAAITFPHVLVIFILFKKK
jgi:Brp/Blh family beta-carotene 15,15'-monooxygenase